MEEVPLNLYEEFVSAIRAKVTLEKLFEKEVIKLPELLAAAVRNILIAPDDKVSIVGESGDALSPDRFVVKDLALTAKLTIDFGFSQFLQTVIIVAKLGGKGKNIDVDVEGTNISVTMPLRPSDPNVNGVAIEVIDVVTKKIRGML